MSRSNQTTAYKREPVRDKNFVMPFGRFKGISIDDVMYSDPKYLLWLHDNTDFELHADLYDEVEESVSRWKP